ncbi:MAG: hypothetical protein WC875_00045 [Candidatus Absconditabacterales bacterium]
MALLLLSLGILGFILFFYGIGLWYVGFFPLIFLVGLFAYYGALQNIKMKSGDILQKYSLFVAWIIILAGLVGVFNFFGMDIIITCLTLMVINLILRIGSYLMKYNDGKMVFQLGYYLSMIFLLVVVATFGGRSGFFSVFMMLWVFQLGIAGFFIFIIGLRETIEEYRWYILGILSLGTIILIIIDKVQNFYIALTLNSLLLTGVFARVRNVLGHQPPSDEKKINISVRRILAGERITQGKKHFSSEFQKTIYGFIFQMPGWVKKLLESMNIGLIVALIYYYVMNISGFANINHLFYRLIIIIFVTNVLLLKKIGYNSIIQNLVVFLVINFAIYISLFSYFNADVGAIVSRAILWNILSASLIFYAHKIPRLAKIFTPVEYTYRLIATVAALVVNIILLINTHIAGELIFFLVLLYIGLQGMILFYAVKYMNKRLLADLLPGAEYK